jgi:hypothetical protein
MNNTALLPRKYHKYIYGIVDICGGCAITGCCAITAGLVADTAEKGVVKCGAAIVTTAVGSSLGLTGIGTFITTLQGINKVSRFYSWGRRALIVGRHLYGYTAGATASPAIIICHQLTGTCHIPGVYNGTEFFRGNLTKELTELDVSELIKKAGDTAK